MSLADVINAAAARYGIDPAYLLRTAQIESSMNPRLANPRSSAKGLFQFIDETRKRYGGFDPYDAAASSDAAARLARDNAAVLRNALGRDPSNAELYLAHQQGAAGAAKLLASPNSPAASIVGPKAISGNGGQPNMTAGEFAQLWTSKFGGAAPSAPSAPVPMADPPELNAALPMMAFAFPPPPPAPQPEEEDPKPRKRQGLDIGQLFADLSPSLVLG